MTKLIIIYGNAGSGKDTQAKLLLESINASDKRAIWFNCSELLKQAIPDFATRAAKGDLISDSETSDIVLGAIRNNGLDYQYIILTGYPRTIKQAMALIELSDDIDLELAKALVLEVPEVELLARINLRNDGRSDDDLNVARKRFEIYSDNINLILEFFQQKKISTQFIDGVGAIKSIHTRILESVHGLF